jgi:tRNA(Ile)-lysidine synthase
VEAFVSRSVGMQSRGDCALDVDASTVETYSIHELMMLWPAIAARVGVTLDRRGTVRLAEFTHRAKVGGRMQLSLGWRVYRSRDALQLRASKDSEHTPAPLALSHGTNWSTWAFRLAREATDTAASESAWSARLPADQPLTVRAWRAGDSMKSDGSGRVHKVKQLLSKAGITGHERSAWPVVVAGEEIVWIPGVRRGDAAADRAGRSGLSFVCEPLPLDR